MTTQHKDQILLIDALDKLEEYQENPPKTQKETKPTGQIYVWDRFKI